VRKQTDLRERIKENQDSIKNFARERQAEKVRNKKLLKSKSDLEIREKEIEKSIFLAKSDLEVREKEIEKSIFLAREELKILRNLCKEKENAKNNIGEFSRKRNREKHFFSKGRIKNFA